ncbi:hypothetical protein D3C75_1310500 [compost metagenome]
MIAQPVLICQSFSPVDSLLSLAYVSWDSTQVTSLDGLTLFASKDKAELALAVVPKPTALRMLWP